jgi:NADPH:quinone reductase-like Zn-dependent oxidoreductase
MKAIVYKRYGGPEVLHLSEVKKPVPQDDEVLVRIRAVSINDWDWANLQGIPKIFRLFSGFKPKQQILGSDIAGVVEAISGNVNKFKPGDEVFGDLSGQWGGFAEYVCTRGDKLALKSPNMSFEEAAAIPQAGMLAVQGLIDRGRIKPGQKILINGAGGGVGIFCVQLSKTYDNVEVTGVDSTRKLEMMRNIGFDHVIDYTREDFTRNGKKYDLILDTKSSRSIFAYPRSLTPNGVYATVGGSLFRLLQYFLLKPLVAMASNKRVYIVMLKVNKDLEYMKQLYDAEKMKVVIDGPYRLEDTAKAFEIYARQEHKGKMVITVDGV